MDVDDDARTIGRRLRRIRKSRGKSLRVLADLSGVLSAASLSRIENGLRALDRRSEIVALANVLQIAPSELTRLLVPAPENGDADGAVIVVRQALMAVSRNQPGGQVVPVEALRTRTRELIVAGRACREAEVGAALPALIRDLHTSIAAGRDVAELLELAVLLHTSGSMAWLRVMGAEVDLRALPTLMARQAAEQSDDPTAMGLAVYDDGLVMITAGDFDLARAELDSVSVPTNSSESMQLEGMLALSRSLLAAAEERPADAAAALDYAGELAEHTGEGNAYWMGFGPTNVALWRMAAALEAGDPERTVTIAKRVNPQVHPNRSRQAAYWLDYGRALARVRARHDEAVMALHRAETISPLHLYRDPFAREVIAGLLTRSRRDSPAGRQLRRMAYRAGLPA